MLHAAVLLLLPAAAALTFIETQTTKPTAR
jgi:hypothetical protein